MKKTLSLILALLMSASCAATIFADEAVATSAIAEDAPAADEEVVVEAETEYDLAIEFLEAKKIMQGKGDGLLHAADAVKRYEMAILAARVATGWVNNDDWMNGTADNTNFTDLEGSGAINALGALSYANQNGIVVGYGDGTFKPENTVTYRDALAIAVRTLGYSGSYPWGIIEKAVSLDLTKGITGVAYTDEIDRGVAAQIIYNALFATAASGKKLAMESFGCEYGWETIAVVADDKVHYEANGADSYKAGVVSFKLVNADGTFASDVYNVAADLKFGAFYNALFEKKGDLVDLIKAIEIEPTVISNRGNDLETADAIGAYLKDLTVVDKYNVKNLSKNTFYNNEIILKGVDTVSVLTGYDYSADEYAIDWVTGDILVKTYDKDGKFVEYVVDWYYSELLDTYYRHTGNSTVVGDKTFIGWDIMDEKDLADLKAAIKATYEVYAKKTGYNVISKPAFNAYADLTVYDVNGAYATYEGYSFGYYSGIAAADKCGDCSTEKVIKIGSYEKILEGTCTHKYQETWTIDELTEGYTGYVIYGVNEATQEFKIVKEIPAYSADLTEDSYVTTGIVRGFDADNNTVTIGNTKYSYEYKGLNGAESYKARTTESDFFTELFNQFVEFVVVDGKIVKIECSGKGGDNYIVVERYLGVDSDGYIVIEGYTTNDLKLSTFRIGAFDGWKQGSAFFYEDVIEGEFVKGNVYRITSTDTTEVNGNVYYVTAIGEWDGDKYITGVAGTMNEATISRQDNYRVVDYTTNTDDLKDKTKRVADGQKYVIIGNVETYALGEFMPIFTFKGQIPAGWTVKGDLLVDTDDLIVIVNVDSISGFNYDTYKTGYVVLLDKNYKVVEFDGYAKDYYIYGATKYTVQAFNLLTAKKDDVAVGYNLDITTKEIYNTIDGAIINDNGKTWAEFWANAEGAYADMNRGDLDYIFETVEVKADDIDTKEHFSKNILSDFAEMNLTGDYSDLIDAYTVKTLTLKNGKIDKIEDYDAKKIFTEGVSAIDAYVVVDVKGGNDVVVYVVVGTADSTAKTEGTTATTTNAIAVGKDAWIIGNAVYDVVETVNDGVKTYKTTIKSLGLEYVGAATTDTHAAVLHDGHYFGIAGKCDTEDWQTTLNGKAVYGSLVEKTYDDHKADDTYTEYVCDLIKAIEVAASDAELVAGKWNEFVIDFVGTKHGDKFDANIMLAFNVDANGKVVELAFATGAGQVVINDYDYVSLLVDAKLVK